MYRREIDGLRAIAVLAVVLYHFDTPVLGGGFVGVDIFFVISGFLIGGILWKEYNETGRISLARFYQRRIKRLAPAYFAMAIVTSAFAWAILLPYEFREFGKMLIAATFYFSNILFFRQTGYFDTAGEEKALLHTWSLSVEEQFYIFLPLLILLVARSKQLLLALLVVLWFASFFANILLTPDMQPATFFLFPFRAWELLSGVLLAIWGYERRCDWDYGKPISWLGIGLIVGSIVLIKPDTGFPGYQVVFPVLGTVLLLLNGRQINLVNATLSSRGFVFFGLISYSLYLWHWPVLVLSKYWRETYQSATETVLWVLICVVLGVLSWRFVERPTRQMDTSIPKVFGLTIIASLCISLFGFLIYKNQGIPQRFDAETQIHIKASGDFLQDFSRCEVAPDGVFAGHNVCALGPSGQDPRVLVWGDSHLRAFAEGIAKAADQAGTAGLLIWNAGCPPLFGINKNETYATPKEDAACNEFNAQMPARLSALPNIERLLLVGRWSYYASGHGIGDDLENSVTLSSTSNKEMPQNEVFITAASNTLNEMSSEFSKVFVLRQVPEIPTYDSRKFAIQLAHGQVTEQSTISMETATLRDAIGGDVFVQAAQSENVTLLDPWPQICDKENCHAIHNMRGLYFDNNHLTNTGARELSTLFAPVFERPAR